MKEKDIVMKREGFLRRAVLTGGRAHCLASVLSLSLTSGLVAQAPNPNDFELRMRLDKAVYNPGDALEATAGVNTKAAGVQGWSFGVKHDTTFLEILSATRQGTDVDGVFSNGFETTTIVEKNGVKVGYIQAIVLSFLKPAEVPVSDFFSMARAGYRVKNNACDGKSGDFQTKVEFAHKEVGVPGSPPVDINLTINGIALGPEEGLKSQPAEVTIHCEAGGEGGLVLTFDKADTDLVADKASTYDLKVLLGNTKTAGGFDVQGWSYGIQLDSAELEALKGEPGVDSKALQGGKGPDFVNYTLNDQNAAGTLHGVTVGAVIELAEPGTAVLPVPAGARKHIDTIQLRSKTEIPSGGSARMTQLKFSDQLGGDRQLEVLVVVGGEGIVPDFSDTLGLNLLPRSDATKPRFIRGDANSDARLDIADGIWIISELFYAGPATACKAAADANADGRRNISDAMYIFQYELQPGKTPGNLFPAPPAPFPGCGTADSVTFEDCPQGSTTCMQ